jgi:hypothetical protein
VKDDEVSLLGKLDEVLEESRALRGNLVGARVPGLVSLSEIPPAAEPPSESAAAPPADPIFTTDGV